MPSPTLTRRALIAGAGTAAASAALAVPYVNAARSAEVDTSPIDPETAGLTGLPLAAFHIERAVAAMAQPGLAGRWQVTIHSGDAEQYWGFRQADAADRAAFSDRPAYAGYADDLSFVSRKINGGGFDYWTVESSGDYSADCERGRILGAEFLAYIGEHSTNHNATLLQCIVNSMMVRCRNPRTSWGRHTSGVEMAFLAAVNEYALATAKILHDHRNA
ncbi:MAG: hypothetical protein ACOH2N_14980 [Devosia sp.]